MPRHRNVRIVIASLVVSSCIALVVSISRRKQEKPPDKPVGTKTSHKAFRGPTVNRKLVSLEARLGRVEAIAKQRAAQAKAPSGEEGRQKPRIDYSRYASRHFDPRIPRHTRISLFIDEKLNDQAEDPEWAQQTEREVEQVVGRYRDSGVTLRSATCKSTLCRMSVDLPAGREHQDILLKIFRDPPFRHHLFVHSEGHQDREVEVYFAREGHRVPELPPDPG